MKYNYMYKIEAQGELELERPGNCCIAANTDSGWLYILIINTIYGKTQVIHYGPVDIEDLSLRTSRCVLEYEEFDYSDHRIDKIIDKFLNQNINITQVFEIDLEEAKSKIKNLIEFLEEE